MYVHTYNVTVCCSVSSTQHSTSIHVCIYNVTVWCSVSSTQHSVLHHVMVDGQTTSRPRDCSGPNVCIVDCCCSGLRHCHGSDSDVGVPGAGRQASCPSTATPQPNAPLASAWCVMHCTVLYCVLYFCCSLGCGVHCTALYCIVLYCVVLSGVVCTALLHCTVLYCVVGCGVYCTVLCCSVLSGVLHCAVLCCSVLASAWCVLHCTGDVLCCSALSRVVCVVLYCTVSLCRVYLILSHKSSVFFPFAHPLSQIFRIFSLRLSSLTNIPYFFPSLILSHRYPVRTCPLQFGRSDRFFPASSLPE